MKTRSTRPIAILILVMILMASCQIPGVTEVIQTQAINPEAIYTAAALTLQAQLTQNAPPVLAPTQPPPTEMGPTSEPWVITATPLPITLTFTPLPFTNTPIPTATTPFTPTSQYPTISASVNTNCRKGPGPEYDIVGALQVGQVAQVHGKNSSSTWWYIENPKFPGNYCWVWGVTTTVSGSTSGLAVLTPPPPPTKTVSKVGFSASYASTHKCGGTKYAIFSVKNTGASMLHSMSIKTRDQTTDAVIAAAASSNDPFLTASGHCPPGEDSLATEDTAFVAGSIAGATSGHDAKAIITLCTKDGLAGTCYTVTVNFTIP
jgi:hypothetical protein